MDYADQLERWATEGPFEEIETMPEDDTLYEERWFDEIAQQFFFRRFKHMLIEVHRFFIGYLTTQEQKQAFENACFDIRHAQTVWSQFRQAEYEKSIGVKP